jgi:hypothetical protein
MSEDQPPADDQKSDKNDDATTIDLTAGAAPPAGAGAGPIDLSTTSPHQPRLELSTYIPEKQQDYVRLTFTVGLLLMFAWVIVWASIESASWPAHWDQTKDMLQIILPALTGLIGSVSGFYFGSRTNTPGKSNTTS